jgi:predicted DNA-binding protein
MVATKSYSLDLETITIIAEIAQETGKRQGRIIAEAIKDYFAKLRQDDDFDDDGEIDPEFAARYKETIRRHKAGETKSYSFKEVFGENA